MAARSIAERCKWVARQLKVAREIGDLTTELHTQILLDELLDQLHTERSADSTG